jgi:hypothetical protein
VSNLVVVLPLKEGAHVRERRALLAEGPPFDLERTDFDRHEVFLTEREVVFVSEAPGSPATLKLPGKDASLWRVAAAWQPLMAGRPRKAETAYSWARPDRPEGVSYAPTLGAGDSERGDVFTLDAGGAAR